MTIDLYTWKTPNGRKVTVMLEELGVPYTLHAVDIGKDEQFSPDFLKVSPNNKIPGIVDRRGAEAVSVFESGAILQHLCDTTDGGERFWPRTPAARATVNQWLMWQMAGIGPFFGRTFRFINGRANDPADIAWVKNEFLDEVERLLRVLDGQLARTGAFMAGPSYSIADIATFPWIDGVLAKFARERPAINDLAHVARWRADVFARPAVQKGMTLP